MPHPVPHSPTVCRTPSQVLNRGSQYRVESMLSRLGRTQDVTMPSPDKERVRQQPALEALPCILEPESRFYTSPVAVLDFRSLYPSVSVTPYCALGVGTTHHAPLYLLSSLCPWALVA